MESGFTAGLLLLLQSSWAASVSKLAFVWEDELAYAGVSTLSCSVCLGFGSMCRWFAVVRSSTLAFGLPSVFYMRGRCLPS